MGWRNFGGARRNRTADMAFAGRCSISIHRKSGAAQGWLETQSSDAAFQSSYSTLLRAKHEKQTPCDGVRTQLILHEYVYNRTDMSSIAKRFRIKESKVLAIVRNYDNAEHTRVSAVPGNRGRVFKAADLNKTGRLPRHLHCRCILEKVR